MQVQGLALPNLSQACPTFFEMKLSDFDGHVDLKKIFDRGKEESLLDGVSGKMSGDVISTFCVAFRRFKVRLQRVAR